MPDQDYWAATPPDKRQFISRKELAAQCGAAQPDLDKVVAFARAHGLEVAETSVARRTVVVSGTVGQVSAAFAVDLGRYESPEETYRGREGHVYIPAEIADVVEGVFGLDNRRVVRRVGGAVAAPSPRIVLPLVPAQVAGLYNFPTVSAAHQTIGILEFGGGFVQADINAAFALYKLPAPGSGAPGAGQLLTFSVDGATNTLAGTAANPSNSDLEVNLDIQVAAGAAPGVNIAMYFAPNNQQGFLDAVNQVIEEDVPPFPPGMPFPSVLSISWSGPEDLGAWSAAGIQSLSSAFQELAWLGVTVFVAADDFGSNMGANDGSPHVPYPTSDPWVTACGGTNVTSIKPLTEGTWNTPGFAPPPPLKPSAGGCTGGGISTVFPVPPWQSGLVATPTTGPAIPLKFRGIPDVVGNASPGYVIVVYGTQFPTLGGCSAVAPLYSALTALFSAEVGELMGYLNPMLYAIAKSTPGVFQPINDGVSNEWTCTNSTPSPCPSTTCLAYLASATPLWNACNGLGRINGNALLTALMPQEAIRAIDPQHPFAFGPSGEWLNYHGTGASDTGNGINAGQTNSAADEDCTLIQTQANDNAAFAAVNTSGGNGAVGLFGRSQGSRWSIGVAGESQTGCGVYGLATGEQPSSKNVVGVAGRSMGGDALEAAPLEQVVGAPIGVLGQSTNGPGVRGHGGPLLKQPASGALLPAVTAAPGGVFSSGRLQDKPLSYIYPSGSPQTVSLDSLSQARLVPSVATELPTDAQVGDLFLVVPGQQGFFAAAQLYLCTAVVPQPGDVANPPGPRWQQVQLGPLLNGGTSV